MTDMTPIEQQALDAALADFDREAEIVLERWRKHLAEANTTGIIWKSTPEEFKTWLEGYTARTQPAFESAEGFLLAGPVSLERRPAYWGHDVVRVSGLAGEHTEGPIEYTSPLTGQRETFTGPHDSYRDTGTIMLFGIIGNPDGTIAIVPDLREPRAAAWYDALLAELRRWAIAPTETQPTEEAKPSIPGRPTERRKWKATWRAIRRLVDEGKPNAQIETWLSQHDADLRCSQETIVKIIAAGEAGLLD